MLPDDPPGHTLYYLHAHAMQTVLQCASARTTHAMHVPGLRWMCSAATATEPTTLSSTITTAAIAAVAAAAQRDDQRP